MSTPASAADSPSRGPAPPPPSPAREADAASPAGRAWGEPAEAVCAQLEVDPQRGLGAEEVAERRQRYGPNTLREHAIEPWWRIVLSQLRGFVVWLLVAAAVASLAFGDWGEAVAIGVVVLINTVVGAWMEISALRSMEALRQLGGAESIVVRDGCEQRIDAGQLVPGDIVVLEAGDVVSADVRLVESTRLQANESTLTGESAPVAKHHEAVEADAVLAERTSMLFKGTSVTRGHARGVVVATGMDTELGHISDLVASTVDEKTPLEERLDALGGKLGWLCLGLAGVLAAVSWLQGRELVLVVETAVALAVATIPEGLPIVATVTLARGMRRMARHHAIVKHLAAVETLGSTSVICTDKTGTLTENHLTLRVVDTGAATIELEPVARARRLVALKPSVEGRADLSDTERARLIEVVELGALCNNARPRQRQPDEVEAEPGDEDAQASDAPIGDPLEVALLDAARVLADTLELDVETLRERWPRRHEVAFDRESRMMATFHDDVDDPGGRLRLAIKGAPEAVLDACTRVRDGDQVRPLDDAGRQCWLKRNEALAARGLRVLGVATGEADSVDDDPYHELTLVALIGMLDPPRDDVRAAIAACHHAGIQVIMVTGDQPVTARQIGRETGIVDEDTPDEVMTGRQLHEALGDAGSDRDALRRIALFARVAPAEKLELIELHQEAGDIVAMTGDGVNDAPALSRADIGVAMGLRGTQVARDASDIVLRDDAFSSITEAIYEGRVIFDNIRAFVVFLMSCNISELMVVSIAALSMPHLPIPITPLQILYLNLVTDVFPALALGMTSGDRDLVMNRPPRPRDEPVLTRGAWAMIAGYGAVITASVLGAWATAMWVLELPTTQTITVAFVTLATAQVLHVLNMRSAGAPVLDNAVVRNPWVLGSIALCLGLIVVPVFVPGLNTVLDLESPGAIGWALALGMATVPLLVGLLPWRALHLGGAARGQGSSRETSSAPT